MIGIDTNVLVRYLAQDDAEQSELATRFVEARLSVGAPGHVSLVALAELVWVLRKQYAAEVPDIEGALTALLCDERFVVQDASAAWVAIDAARRPGIELADALIAALDRLHGCTHTVSFDIKAARLAGVRLLQ